MFDIRATISCMSKACSNRLDPKPVSIQTHAYKVNCVDGNSLGPLGTSTCALNSPKNQQQLIIGEHLLCPIILGLDFLHNYLIGIDWFFW